MENLEIIQESNEALVPQEKPDNSVVLAKVNKSIEDDYESGRATLKTLIETGMNSLNNLATLAQEAEHPKVYEALSSMINTIANNQKMLMDLNIQYKKQLMLDNPKTSTPTNVNIDKAAFFGSSLDMLKVLKGGE